MTATDSGTRVLPLFTPCPFLLSSVYIRACQIGRLKIRSAGSSWANRIHSRPGMCAADEVSGQPSAGLFIIEECHRVSSKARISVCGWLYVHGLLSCSPYIDWS